MKVYCAAGVLFAVLVFGACGGDSGSADDVLTSTNTPLGTGATPTPRAEIELTVSLYLVVAEEGDADLSSQRTEDDLAEIAAGMSEIWGPSGIRFEFRIDTIEVPQEILVDSLTSDFRSFFKQVGAAFQVPSPSLINGFYVRTLGGANGIAAGRDTFFVIDEPTVFDRRVTSHEVGHILGLHHDFADADSLMFSGTNGMSLSDAEMVVARYFAAGMLSGAR